MAGCSDVFDATGSTDTCTFKGGDLNDVCVYNQRTRERDLLAALESLQEKALWIYIFLQFYLLASH